MPKECKKEKGGGANAPDRIPSPQSNPLRNRTILLLGARKLLLRAEGFVALFVISKQLMLAIAPRYGASMYISFGAIV